MSFGYVAPPYGALWPQAAAMLARSITRGKNDWGEVMDSLADGRSQLWIETEPPAAMVTRLDGDTLEVWLAGGAVMRCLANLETAVEASKAAGTTNGRIIGRKGWARALKAWGWQQQGDELVRDWR